MHYQQRIRLILPTQEAFTKLNDPYGKAVIQNNLLSKKTFLPFICYSPITTYSHK